MTKKQVQLKVVEAFQEDAYKGIARLDTEMMRSLEINRGDVVLIKGHRETVAIADRAYPADVGEGIIRIDGILRKNARTGIGDVVVISKADVKEAKKIIIAPAQKNIMVQGDSESLRAGLLGRAIIKGDILKIGGAQKRMDLMSDVFGEDLSNTPFGNIFGNLGGGLTQINFLVVNTSPNKPCYVSENTEVVLNPKAVEISDEKIPEINYEDIGGLSEEIKKIREMVEIPLKHPEIFQRLGVESPKGVLLHGPPGTGKTLLAKAVAKESEANFIQVKGPSLLSMWVGKSEEGMRKIFERARQVAPCIIFFDEIDSLAGKRGMETGTKVTERVLNQMLAEMDGLEDLKDILVIAATNRPDLLDTALLRPGRFDRILLVNAPEEEGRKMILDIHTKDMPIKISKEEVKEFDKQFKNEKFNGKEVLVSDKPVEQFNLDKLKKKKINFRELSDKEKLLHHLAKKTIGYTGADLEAFVREAAMLSLRESIDSKEVNKKHFEEALNKIKPSVNKSTINVYKQVEENYLKSAKASEPLTNSYLG